MLDLDNPQQKGETKFNKMALIDYSFLVFYFHSFCRPDSQSLNLFSPPIDYNHQQPESKQLTSGRGNFTRICQLHGYHFYLPSV